MTWIVLDSSLFAILVGNLWLFKNRFHYNWPSPPTQTKTYYLPSLFSLPFSFNSCMCVCMCVKCFTVQSMLAWCIMQTGPQTLRSSICLLGTMLIGTHRHSLPTYSTVLLTLCSFFLFWKFNYFILLLFWVLRFRVISVTCPSSKNLKFRNSSSLPSQTNKQMLLRNLLGENIDGKGIKTKDTNPVLLTLAKAQMDQ